MTDKPVILDAPNCPSGRPTIYKPEYVQSVLRSMMRDPAPSILQISVDLDCWPQRIYEWAHKYPDFADALHQAKARHALTVVKRLEIPGVDPNAMFLLKALHGYTDRPDLGQQIQGRIEVVVTHRYSGPKQIDGPGATEIEYERVDSDKPNDSSDVG